MGKFIEAFVLAVLLFAAGCKKDNTPDYSYRSSYFHNIVDFASTDSVIKCITYNIRLGFDEAAGDPWNQYDKGVTEEYLVRLTELLLAAGPDIICLQEVPRNRYNAEIKDFIERLATALNMNYAFGAHGYNDPLGIEPVHGEWGNAILSKYPIEGIDNHENEYRSVWERRSILSARMNISGYPVTLYSLHFLPSSSAIPNALPFFKKDDHHHQVIMGDFNMVKAPDLESAGYTDIMKGDTSLSISAIDRIFISQNRFAVLEYGGIEGSLGMSNHIANYCVLKLR